MLSIYTQIAFGFWIILFLVWFIGYFNTKKTLRRPELGRYLVSTALFALGYFLLFGAQLFNASGASFTPQSSLLGVIGDVLCGCGISFAIWARIALGSNWSGNVATLKERHELIQSGPYAIVRHPIYTGFFFGMLGVALTVGTLASYGGVLLAFIAGLIRVPIEERLMMEQFPESYSEYKKKVRALIPFVW